MSKASVQVEGIVAQDVTVRETQSGKRVASVTIAHTPQRKNDAGEWVDTGSTTWFEAAFWDEMADAVQAGVSKLDLVVLSGQPEVSTFEKSNGETAVKVVVKNPTLARVVRKAKGTSQRPVTAPVAAEQWSTAPTGGQGGFDGYESTVPF